MRRFSFSAVVGLVAAAVMVVLGIQPASAALAGGDYDPSFVSGTGFDQFVTAIAPRPDGSMLVGGYFATYNGTTANRIVSLNTDGSVDTSFVTGTGFNNAVLSIYAHETAGTVDYFLVGGSFTQYNGVSVGPLVKLSPTGALDTTFTAQLGTFTDNTFLVVNRVRPLIDGNYLISGNFQSIGGVAVGNLAKISPTGVFDTRFNANLGTGFTGPKYPHTGSFAQQSTGKIIVAGGFTALNGNSQGALARIDADGTPDTAFNSAVQAFNIDPDKFPVQYVAIDLADNILLGGDFSTYGANTVPRYMRLLPDGTVDTSFNSGGAGFDDRVVNITPLGDGSVVLTGFFTTYNGTAANKMIMLTPTGAIDNSFTSHGFDLYRYPYTLMILPSGNIMIGGTFTQYDVNTTPVSAVRIARLGFTPPAALWPAIQTDTGRVGVFFSTTPLTPTFFSSAVSCSLAETLPAGLEFDSATGVISGTPIATLTETTFTVTCTGTESRTATINLSVTAAPSVTPSTQTITKQVGQGITSTALTPSNMGTVTYALTGTLPAGLTFDSATGVIHGIPTEAFSATTLTITGTDEFGATVTATIELTVTATPDGPVLPDTGATVAPYLEVTALLATVGAVLVSRRRAIK